MAIQTIDVGAVKSEQNVALQMMNSGTITVALCNITGSKVNILFCLDRQGIKNKKVIECIVTDQCTEIDIPQEYLEAKHFYMYVMNETRTQILYTFVCDVKEVREQRPMMMRTMTRAKSNVVNDVFMIDAETRTINVPSTEQFFGVFSDRNVERKYFKCPKIVGDNVDLSACQIFINYVSVSGKHGKYHCTDMAVSDDGQYIEFTWLLTGNVFDSNVVGNVAFAMQAKNEAGENVFNTKKAVGTTADTIESDSYIQETYADVILEMLVRIDTLEKNPIAPETIEKAVQKYLTEHPVAVPTKVSQLENDLKYQTEEQVKELIKQGGDGITEIPQATLTQLGGIKAEPRTENESLEIKIDPITGKLYAPKSESNITVQQTQNVLTIE